MEIKKIYLLACIPGRLSGLLIFQVFLALGLSKIGVTWNSYTQYALELSVVLLVGFMIGHRIKKKQKQKNKE